jgi:hypothetical protein
VPLAGSARSDDGSYDERVAAEFRERWSGWKREPFTTDSRKHVSGLAKPAD